MAAPPPAAVAGAPPAPPGAGAALGGGAPGVVIGVGGGPGVAPAAVAGGGLKERFIQGVRDLRAYFPDDVWCTLGVIFTTFVAVVGLTEIGISLLKPDDRQECVHADSQSVPDALDSQSVVVLDATTETFPTHHQVCSDERRALVWCLVSILCGTWMNFVLLYKLRQRPAWSSYYTGEQQSAEVLDDGSSSYNPYIRPEVPAYGQSSNVPERLNSGARMPGWYYRGPGSHRRSGGGRGDGREGGRGWEKVWFVPRPEGGGVPALPPFEVEVGDDVPLSPWFPGFRNSCGFNTREIVLWPLICFSFIWFVSSRCGRG